MAFPHCKFLLHYRILPSNSWLQYFGRDSMIALRLLMPTLTSEAIEAALGAVIERANTTGALCHEETIGTYRLPLLSLYMLTNIIRRLCIFCMNLGVLSQKIKILT